VKANLLGASLGLYTSRSIAIRARKRKELQRLYQPLDTVVPYSSSSDDEGEEPEGEGREMVDSSTESKLVQSADARGRGKRARVEDNPWDDGESIFGIGDD
jgi:hypothetical protein